MVVEIMTKGSTWRRFCCTCSNAQDDAALETSYVAPRRQGPLSRVKSAKSTWTRRSLLENEQSTVDDPGHHVPIELMAYQMRSIETPTNIPRTLNEDDDYDVRRRIANTTQYRQRQSVQHAFDVTSTPRTNAPDVKTTFPWMDEGFAQTTRSGTRLGIRSLQMNATGNNLQGIGINIGRTRTSGSEVGPRNIQTTKHAFHPYAKSQSFTEGESDSHFIPYRGALNPTHQAHLLQFPPNNHPMPLSVANQFNVHTSVPVPGPELPKSAIPRPPPTVTVMKNCHQSEHTQVLRSPKSDVAVRRILANESKPRHEVSIPKLDDYPGIHYSRSSDINGNSNVKSRTSVMDIFPKLEETGDIVDEDINKPWNNIGDTSYSSDFTLKKAPSDVDNDLSSQKPSHASMFSVKPSKYERLKAHSTKGKGNKKPDLKNKNKGRADSMYGYVPKVVQNVHASTALEGNQIDDFFKMQAKRKHRPTSRNSISEDTNYIILSSESESDDDPFIVDTVMEENNPTETQELQDTIEPKSIQRIESVPDEGTLELQQALTNSRSVTTRVAICDTKYEHKALEHDIDQVFMNLNLEKAARASRETNSKNIYLENKPVKSALSNCEESTTKYYSTDHSDGLGDPDDSYVFERRDLNTSINSPDANKAGTTGSIGHSTISAPVSLMNGHSGSLTASELDTSITNSAEVIMIDFPPNADTDKSTAMSNMSRKDMSPTCDKSDVSSQPSTTCTAKSVIKYREVLY